MIRPYLIALLATLSLADVQLNCQNGGTSSKTHCLCPPNFVGSTCELPANLLTQDPTTHTIQTEYTYFYYQPREVNFYKLNFTICMQKNPSETATQFFISTQKINGSLQALPAFYQTYQLVLQQNGCTNFTSHYISIKRKQDSSFRRIIVGMKIMKPDPKRFYFNVHKSQNISRQKQIQMIQNQVENSQPQRFNIKMEYQLYLQTSYGSSFVILLTSLVLMVLFAVAIAYIKKKYNEQEEQFNSFRFTDEQRYSSVRRRHNPQLEDYVGKNDLTVTHVFMPATIYGTCSKYYNHSMLRSCTELPEKYGYSQSCSICLLQFQKQDEIRTTPCRHRYHRECIDNWCENNLTCPICRNRLDFQEQFRTIYLKYLRGQLEISL